MRKKFTEIKTKLKGFDIKKFFMRDKHRKVMGVVVIMAVALVFIFGIDYIVPSRVKIVYATMDGVKTKEIKTRSGNVENAVKDSGVKVKSTDMVYPCRDHDVKDGMTIKVAEGIRSTAVIQGENKEIYLFPGTVEENLRYNGIKFDDDDILIPERGTVVTADTKIEMQELHTSTETKKETVEPIDEVVFDPSITSGTITSVTGESGEGEFNYVTTYINGKKDHVDRKLKKWIKEPKNNSVRFGTSVTGQTGSVKYTRTFTGNTTAYYMGENAHGAAGSRCHYGTCAVDPSYVPYGTKLYIEGYGFAVANDCGSAVKGNVVDLYMRSMSECYSWGRRHVKVYVLE